MKTLPQVDILIIANNASTDTTPNIIKKYVEEYLDLLIPTISPKLSKSFSTYMIINYKERS